MADVAIILWQGSSNGVLKGRAASNPSLENVYIDCGQYSVDGEHGDIHASFNQIFPEGRNVRWRITVPGSQNKLSAGLACSGEWSGDQVGQFHGKKDGHLSIWDLFCTVAEENRQLLSANRDSRSGIRIPVIADRDLVAPMHISAAIKVQALCRGRLTRQLVAELRALQAELQQRHSQGHSQGHSLQTDAADDRHACSAVLNASAESVGARRLASDSDDVAETDSAEEDERSTSTSIYKASQACMGDGMARVEGNSLNDSCKSDEAEYDAVLNRRSHVDGTARTTSVHSKDGAVKESVAISISQARLPVVDVSAPQPVPRDDDGESRSNDNEELLLRINSLINGTTNSVDDANASALHQVNSSEYMTSPLVTSSQQDRQGTSGRRVDSRAVRHTGKTANRHAVRTSVSGPRDYTIDSDTGMVGSAVQSPAQRAARVAKARRMESLRSRERMEALRTQKAGGQKKRRKGDKSKH